MNNDSYIAEKKVEGKRWSITTIIAVLALANSGYNTIIFQQSANDTMAKSDSGIVLQSESNHTQKTSTTIAQKALDAENSKLIMELTEKMSKSPIYYCREGSRVEKSQPLCDSFSSEYYTKDSSISNQGASALSMLWNELDKWFDKEDILRLFPKTMVQTICNNSEVRSVAGPNPNLYNSMQSACDKLLG